MSENTSTSTASPVYRASPPQVVLGPCFGTGWRGTNYNSSEQPPPAASFGGGIACAARVARRKRPGLIPPAADKGCKRPCGSRLRARAERMDGAKPQAALSSISATPGRVDNLQALGQPLLAASGDLASNGSYQKNHRHEQEE